MKFGNATKFRPHDDKVNSVFVPEDLDLLFSLDIDINKTNIKAKKPEYGRYGECSDKNEGSN